MQSTKLGITPCHWDCSVLSCSLQYCEPGNSLALQDALIDAQIQLTWQNPGNTFLYFRYSPIKQG